MISILPGRPLAWNSSASASENLTLLPSLTWRSPCFRRRCTASRRKGASFPDRPTLHNHVYRSSPSDGRSTMPWTKTADVAMFEGADWSSFKKVVGNCSPPQAPRIAMLDPAIRFFFFCREPMVLTNPGWPGPRSFSPGDAVFFTGEPWWGSAPQCDGYRKSGLSTAYIDGLTAADPGLPLVAGQYVTAQG